MLISTAETPKRQGVDRNVAKEECQEDAGMYGALTTGSNIHGAKARLGDESVYKARTDQEAQWTRELWDPSPSCAVAFETFSLRQSQLDT